MRKLFWLIVTIIFCSSCSYKLQDNNGKTEDDFPEQVTEEVTERSENIANYVKQADYVENATATIVGERAVISVDFNRNFAEKEIAEIKKELREKALLYDKTLEDVTISTTPHMIDKATDFAGESENTEHPVSDEIEEITTPSMPTL